MPACGHHAEDNGAVASEGLLLSLQSRMLPPCFVGNEEGRILALTTGFVAPLFGLMHCDTLQ
eukprot:1144903-Pelagomonas_calceolata.AAC.1